MDPEAVPVFFSAPIWAIEEHHVAQPREHGMVRR
jgi:hypothetical protein